MRCLLLLLLSCVTTFIRAQQFGGTPASVKWKQVNTDTARIIYPQGLDSVAQRIANVTHQLQRNYSNTIGSHVRKINIVLQQDLTLSNAYVGLAPYRSEFYLMPPQNAFDLGAQNWPDNLAIHEFRHVQQYGNFNRGLSRAASVLLGEQGQAVANAAAVPNWFFEGDAVYNETLLSDQGRGRLPSFLNSYKALFLEGRKYSYMKLRNGSLKDYVPNHYPLGYMLVAYGREKYGNDFWKKVTADAAAFHPLFYPMQGAVKKYAGVDFTGFVGNAFSFYEAQWKSETAKLNWLTPARKNNVISYQYPYLTTDGKIIALKTTQKKVNSFVLLDRNGGEKKIATRDIAYDDYFSYNNGKLVYTILKPDIRWGNREYSVIKIHDIASGSESRISTKSKYFSPDISHDGKTVAAVEILPDQTSSIILMNNEGSEVKKWHTSKTLVYSYPKFAADDKAVYIMVRNSKGYMSLQKMDIKDGTLHPLIPFVNTIIGFPVVKGDTITYSCTSEGKDELWAYIESKQQSYRLASYPTGLYQGLLDNNGQLITSAFNASGYRLAAIQPGWQKAEETVLKALYIDKVEDKTANELLSEPLNKTYPVSGYSKGYGLFNFHSWRPYYDQPEYSFTLYSDNVLNTFQNRLSYTFNSNESSHKAGYTAVYGGWYVQPYAGVSETWNRTARLNADTSVHWNEFNAQGGLQLPLNFSGGRMYRYLTLYSAYNYSKVNWTGLGKQLYRNIDFSYLNSGIIYQWQVQKAPQHIYPRWGQSIQLQYRNIIGKYTGNQFLAKTSLYIPGLFSTHSIVLSAAYQARDTMGQYTFSNNFPFSRGYIALNYPRMTLLSANYHLPLVYPDWGFGNIVYFQRIRLNAFFDYTDGKSLRTNTHTAFKTAGAEIYFDTRWWNQQPVTFGLRYSHLLNAELTRQSASQFEFILPVNLLSQ